MTTIIVLTLAAAGILVLLGATVTFSWLCSMAAGRAVGWALGVEDRKPADAALSSERVAEMDALVAESQRLLRESERRAAFSRA